MEHRWNTRTPVEVGVTVNFSQLGLIAARTRDLSLGGAYLETNSVNLGKHSVLEIVFPNRKKQNQMVNLPATVVRADDSGVAVQFTDFNPDGIATLTELMGAAGATQF